MEVDVNTGETRVLQVVAAHDVGQTIHRTNVEGQIEGGYMMGQGYALSEEYVIQDGIPRTTSLATFLMPTILDAPSHIVPVIVEEPNPDGPYGAIGCWRDDHVAYARSHRSGCSRCRWGLGR